MIFKCNDTFKRVGKNMALLGEGPVWDESSDTLYWVDIKGRALHAHRPGSKIDRRINLPIEVTQLHLEWGGLIAATRNGFAFLDPQVGKVNQIEDPEAEFLGNRFNDGTVDNLGNFIAGTMHELETDNTGSVYAWIARSGQAIVWRIHRMQRPSLQSRWLHTYFSNSSERNFSVSL